MPRRSKYTPVRETRTHEDWKGEGVYSRWQRRPAPPPPESDLRDFERRHRRDGWREATSEERRQLLAAGVAFTTADIVYIKPSEGLFGLEFEVFSATGARVTSGTL